MVRRRFIDHFASSFLFQLCLNFGNNTIILKITCETLLFHCKHIGQKLVEPLVIGICGGSASGKTTVANKIITSLDVQWVTLLCMDSFYKVI